MHDGNSPHKAAYYNSNYAVIELFTVYSKIYIYIYATVTRVVRPSFETGDS